MKDFVELKMAESKCQLEAAKVRFSAARHFENEVACTLEKNNISYWEGYLSALEDIQKNEQGK